MLPFDLLIFLLAAWYWAYVLTSTSGPFEVFEPLQRFSLFQCPYCLAFWIAVLFVLAPRGVFTDASAVAGGAMLLHGYTGHRFNT